MKSSKKTKKHVYGAQSDMLNADIENNEQILQGDVSVDNSLVDGGKSSAKHHKKERGKVKLPRFPYIDNTSFLALLFRSFLSYALIIIIGVSLIFVFSYYSVRTAHNAIVSSNVSNYINALRDEHYSEIPVSNVVGEGGWFEVVSASGDVVYSTLSQATAYTVDEIDVIQRVEKDETLTLTTFKGANNQDNHLVTKTFYDENGEKQEQYLLFDENLAIVSGTIQTNKTQFTQKEFDYFTFNAVNSDAKLTKYAFENKQGDDFYVITYDVRKENTNRQEYFLIFSLVVCILILFSVTIFFYVRYIDKHVQKPLDALSGAMTRLAKDNYREKIEYQGSKEFAQLYDSFNEMVTLLNESEAQRDVLEQDKLRMLAGLSHDLKTPITIIEGFAKAIRDGIITDDDKAKYLQIIISKSDMMVDLINEFYEYTKLEHPDFAIDAQPIDVAEFARTFLVDIYDEFDLRGYNLEADIPEEQLICNIDKKQFSHVFNNLTSNFFKYTKPGTTLFFGIERVDDNVLIHVADNGTGISPEARADIFKAFVVGEQSRNKQGSGLGLAVCQRIVEAHGGQITLNDNPIENYTTQFDISIKLANEN